MYHYRPHKLIYLLIIIFGFYLCWYHISVLQNSQKKKKVYYRLYSTTTGPLLLQYYSTTALSFLSPFFNNILMLDLNLMVVFLYTKKLIVVLVFEKVKSSAFFHCLSRLGNIWLYLVPRPAQLWNSVVFISLVKNARPRVSPQIT